MNQIQVRPAAHNDVESVAHLVASNSDSAVDPAIFAYPHTQVLVADSAKGIEAVLPIQLTMTIESPGWRATSLIRRAKAFIALWHHARNLAESKGIKEIYFLTNDEDIARHARKQGFEEMPFRTFRYKV